jgi:hypothetical protein
MTKAYEQQPEESAKAFAAPWPKPLEAAALHGVAGELVRCLDPHRQGIVMERFLRLAEVQRIFGVSRTTVWNWQALPSARATRKWKNAALAGRTRAVRQRERRLDL